MPGRRWLIALFCLAVAGLGVGHPAGGHPAWAQDPAAGTVVVAGVVENGTAGGDIPANLPLTLHSVDPAAGRVATLETTTDDQAAFRFDAPPLPAGGSYVLVMDYAGMRYSSLLEERPRGESARFLVYETTRDIGVVQVERQAMIIADISEREREISALEVLSVNNASDRTLLPELTNITNPADINFLRFSLPAEASGLDVQSTLPGGDIIPIGTGFAVTAPVPPGRHRINYTYRFPYQADRVTFNQRLIQGAQVYQVLAPESLSEIRIEPLQPQPRINVEGSTYLVWEEQEIPPRRGITLTFSHLPQPSQPAQWLRAATAGGFWQRAIPIGLGAALAAILVYAWFRGPRSVPAGGGSGAGIADIGPADGSRQALVQAVARLDEGFERGEVPEPEYRLRREELLAQLRRMSNPDPEEGGAER